MLKGVLAKLIKHIENYFLDQEQYSHYHFDNIALIYEFTEDYDVLRDLIELRFFENEKYKINLERTLTSSIRKK